MRRLALCLSLSLAVVGCSTEIDTSTRPDNVVGTYRLVTWGGQPLPTTIRSDSTGRAQVLSGELTLSADRSWTETTQVKVTPAVGAVTTAPVVSRGNWSFVRDYAYMLFNDKTQGYQFSGMAAGGGITLDLVSGAKLVYRK